MSFELQFLGGAGTVTGSKYLITYKSHKILVDCGLFQGLKSLRLQNWEPFHVDPSGIDAVILTHAHIDHSGYIPRLIKEGFKGKVYSTPATRDLCAILLPDAGYLAEEEAEYLNKTKKTKHSPALPLFTEKEAEQSLAYFSPVGMNLIKNLNSEIQFEFHYAGHILGAATVALTIAGKKIIFSGDIGRPNDKVFMPPAVLSETDYLVIESTYGNRLHPDTNAMEDLAHVVNENFKKKGVLIIPAFAVGRAQELIFLLAQLKEQNRIPDFPIYLNSPMATDASEILQKYQNLHKLSDEQCRKTFSSVKYIRSAEESKVLNNRTGPMAIISASGMLTGGRVLHHLKAFAPYPNNTILLTGYQAAGTRGEALEKGARELKIHGEYVPINAEVKTLHNMSAHADYKEILEWLAQKPIHPKKVFVTHGEPSASDDLRRRLTETFSWNCYVPSYQEKVVLG